MSKVTAVKKGVERKFSKTAWDLMGKDKNGYILVPDEVAKQEIQKKDNSSKKNKGNDAPIGDSPKTSKDFTVDGVITKLKEINSIEELNAFAVGETRENYLNLIKKRDTEITEALEGAGENDYTGPFSTDEGMSVKEANKHIDTLETVETINLFVATDETRATVLKYQTAAIVKLEQN